MEPPKLNLQKSRIRKQIFLPAVLALAVFTLPIGAKAADVLHLRGDGASASFFSVDPSNCVSTSVFVQFGEASIKNPPDPGEHVSIAAVYISQYDFCAGVQLVSVSTQGDFPLPANAAQVEKHLNAATLNATIQAFDYLNNLPVNVDVHLNWTSSNDPPFRSNGTFHFQSPGVTFSSHSRSISRAAEVSGSLSLGAVNLATPPGTGQVESAMSGEVRIDHR
jgi:hypothetical protein